MTDLEYSFFIIMKEMGYTPEQVMNLTTKQFLFILRGLKRYYKEQEQYINSVGR